MVRPSARLQRARWTSTSARNWRSGASAAHVRRLQQRALDFIQNIQPENAEKQILIVAHGGLIRALLAHVLNMPLKGLFRFNIDYASVTELDFGEKVAKINFVNL